MELNGAKQATVGNLIKKEHYFGELVILSETKWSEGSRHLTAAMASENRPWYINEILRVAQGDKFFGLERPG